MNLLVTRPKEDAHRLAAPLQKLGFQVTCAPLLVAQYRPPPVWPDWSDVQGMLFSSAHGVRALHHTLGNHSHWETIQALSTMAVGPHTADTLKQYGFSSVTCANGDWRALVQHVSRHFQVQKGRLLHITGTARVGDMGGTLTAQGYSYHRLPVYDMPRVQDLPVSVIGDFSHQRLDGVTLCSSRTAHTFVSLVKKAGLVDAMEHMTAWCLSPAIATYLRPLPFACVRVASRPNLPSFIALFSQNNPEIHAPALNTGHPDTTCTSQRRPHNVGRRP